VQLAPPCPLDEKAIRDVSAALDSASLHPRSSKNLALRAWDGENSAIKKDKLERRMQVMVCAGPLSLGAATSAIYFDWLGAFMRYMPSSKIPSSISQG